MLYALMLTLLAGLSTGLGGALAFFTRRTNTTILSFSLGFSAGVMIYVSFMEIYPEGLALLKAAYGEKSGTLISVLSFFAGIVCIGIIDMLVPTAQNPHEAPNVQTFYQAKKLDKEVAEIAIDSELQRTGLFAVLAIAIHNFPEGVAVFMAALNDQGIGLAIAIAIAIHNIPEGIAVAIPLYYATGSAKKAFALASLSGLAEPVGALIAYLILGPYLGPELLGIVFCGIAGIMVFISLDELLPTAERYAKHHICTLGVLSGMLIMAISLLIL